VIGSPSIISGSQIPCIQIVGACALGSQITLQRSKDETQGHEETAPQEVTSGKRKPRWFLETLKESKEYVGETQRLIRERREPERFGSYLAMVTSITDSKPTNFSHEYDSIMHNDVWEVVARLEGKSMGTSRWIYKIKYAAIDNIEKHNAHFVARGFSQIEGIDYDETFPPIVRYNSI